MFYIQETSGAAPDPPRPTAEYLKKIVGTLLTGQSIDDKLQVSRLTIDRQEDKTVTDYKLGAVESRFADIVWNREPLPSGELVKLCAQELEWKKSTTYTVLKKLCEKGLFANDNGTVRAVMTREEYYAAQSRQFVEETFEGSLPAFISAFSSGRRLTEQDVAEIRSLLDNWSPLS